MAPLMIESVYGQAKRGESFADNDSKPPTAQNQTPSDPHKRTAGLSPKGQTRLAFPSGLRYQAPRARVAYA
jgi:hypothetical protein